MNEALRAACDRVFQYSPVPPPRRHGPCGYSDYQFYKPWLRDEFTFRCLYCLWRERWQADGHHDFGVEHVHAQATEPGKRLDYDNLIYACNLCNSTRREVPSSLIALLRSSNAPEAIEALRDLLAFPSDLPNLAALRPPDGNARPDGVAGSFFERWRRGDLDDVY